MAEIGAALREARMRAHIDISEIEAQTKIRAKYLRALENEEWDLLPGPTYVKSFLRTYADALGLDGRRLVEEYKLHNERLSDVEAQPIAPPGRASRGPSRPRFSRGWAIAIAVVVLAVALYALGRSATTNDRTVGESHHNTTRTGPAASSGHRRHRHGQSTAATPAAPPSRVRLKLVPSSDVWVCLVANNSKTLIDGVTLPAGQATPTFHAKRFELTLGNSSVSMQVDGRTVAVPSSTVPLGYELRPGGHRRTLDEASRPTCQ